MNEQVLREMLLDQNAKQHKDLIVPRIIEGKAFDIVKTKYIIIITGIRRSGKSTLLNIIRKKHKGVYFNFDDNRLLDFTVSDFEKLYDLIKEIYGNKNILYFDEIQNIPGWERFVRRLRDEEVKVFITGSNASMLSRELGTKLTGRYLSLELYPFSFKEYLKSKNVPSKTKNITSDERIVLKKELVNYLEEGGFPEYLETKKEEYLKTLFENILFRDIIVRYKLTNKKPIKQVAHFVASNIGKEMSFNQLRKLTGLSSATTIREYFEYLENSYLCFLVSKFDYSLKKMTFNNKKVYLIDTGIAKTIGFRPTKDEGRMLENTVFIELKRRYKEIYYYKNKHECDFVIVERGRPFLAIQVCLNINEENKDRELNGLKEVMKDLKIKEGIIVTLDQEDELEGIKLLPAWKWLCNN